MESDVFLFGSSFSEGLAGGAVHVHPVEMAVGFLGMLGH